MLKYSKINKINKINYVLDCEFILLKYINFTCFMAKTKITYKQKVTFAVLQIDGNINIASLVLKHVTKA